MRRILTLALLLLFFAQSCTPSNLPAVETAPAAIETQGSPAVSASSSTAGTVEAPLQSPTPSLPSATPTQEATSTPTACMQAGGRVTSDDISTELLPEPFEFVIYLPPCYEEEADRRYPVLYLVHGKNASDSQWVSMGVPDKLDMLVERDELPPFIVVMPRARIWTEPAGDKFGEALVQALIPWIDEHYRTLPEREYRAIGGLSWGGAWALHLGFSHPELFSAVGMHSAIVFNTDVIPVMGWVKDLASGMAPRVYMDIGDQDRPENIKELSYVDGLLSKYSIPHAWHIYTGKHDDTYWKSHVEEYLRWYGYRWKNDPALINP